MASLKSSTNAFRSVPSWLVTIPFSETTSPPSKHLRPKRVLAVDHEKTNEALDVVSVAESAVYDTDESEYVRKAEVDKEHKETRLQGLKDRLTVSDDPEAEVLHKRLNA